MVLHVYRVYMIWRLLQKQAWTFIPFQDQLFRKESTKDKKLHWKNPRITLFFICWSLFQISHKHPEAEWISNRTHMGITVVILTISVYDSKGFRVKGKRYILAMSREVRCRLLSLSLPGSYNLPCIQQLTTQTHVKCPLQSQG